MDNLAKYTRATIVPTLRYRDAPAAVDWLGEAFGFETKLVVPDGEGGIAHAQLAFGNGMVMLGTARDDAFGRIQRPLDTPGEPVSQSPYVIVTDVDAHHARAAAAGADVLVEPEDQDHGGRYYAATRRATSGISAATIPGKTTPRRNRSTSVLGARGRSRTGMDCSEGF